MDKTATAALMVRDGVCISSCHFFLNFGLDSLKNVHRVGRLVVYHVHLSADVLRVIISSRRCRCLDDTGRDQVCRLALGRRQVTVMSLLVGIVAALLVVCVSESGEDPATVEKWPSTVISLDGLTALVFQSVAVAIIDHLDAGRATVY